jgi:hypothetical protein
MCCKFCKARGVPLVKFLGSLQRTPTPTAAAHQTTASASGACISPTWPGVGWRGSDCRQSAAAAGHSRLPRSRGHSKLRLRTLCPRSALGAAAGFPLVPLPRWSPRRAPSSTAWPWKEPGSGRMLVAARQKTLRGCRGRSTGTLQHQGGARGGALQAGTRNVSANLRRFAWWPFTHWSGSLLSCIEKGCQYSCAWETISPPW